MLREDIKNNNIYPEQKNIGFLGLGSNMMQPETQLHKAIEILSNSSFLSVIAISDFIHSKPYGPVKDQGDFVNAVIAISCWYSPRALLSFIEVVESFMGKKKICRWGPRIIDIDILLYHNRVYNTKYLKIPHVDMHNRPFVIRPLSQVFNKLGKKYPLIDHSLYPFII